MNIKTIAVVAAVAAGTFGFAERADAQFRRGRAYYPTYSNSTGVGIYSSTPVLSSGIYTSNGVVIPSSGVIQAGVNSSYYGTPYTSNYYSPYGSSYYGSSYYNGGNYNTGYYNSGVYNSGYNNIYGGVRSGVNVGRSGVYYGGRRIGRW